MDMDEMWAKLTIIAMRSMDPFNYNRIEQVRLVSMEEAAALCWFVNLPVGPLEAFRATNLTPIVQLDPVSDEDADKDAVESSQWYRHRMSRYRFNIALVVLIRDVYWALIDPEGAKIVSVTLITKEPIAVKNYTIDKRNAVAIQLAVIEHVVEEYEKRFRNETFTYLVDFLSILLRWSKGDSQKTEVKNLTEIEYLVLKLDEEVKETNQTHCVEHASYIMLIHALDCIARAAHDCDKTQTRSCHIDDTSLWWCQLALHELRLLNDKNTTEEETQAEIVILWAAAIKRQE